MERPQTESSKRLQSIADAASLDSMKPEVDSFAHPLAAIPRLCITLTAPAACVLAVVLLLNGQWRELLWGIGAVLVGGQLLAIALTFSTKFVSSRLFACPSRPAPREFFWIAAIAAAYDGALLFTWFGAVFRVVGGGLAVRPFSLLAWCLCVAVLPWFLHSIGMPPHFEPQQRSRGAAMWFQLIWDGMAIALVVYVAGGDRIALLVGWGLRYVLFVVMSGRAAVISKQVPVHLWGTKTVLFHGQMIEGADFWSERRGSGAPNGLS